MLLPQEIHDETLQLPIKSPLLFVSFEDGTTIMLLNNPIIRKKWNSAIVSAGLWEFVELEVQVSQFDNWCELVI